MKRSRWAWAWCCRSLGGRAKWTCLVDMLTGCRVRSLCAEHERVFYATWRKR